MTLQMKITSRFILSVSFCWVISQFTALAGIRVVTSTSQLADIVKNVGGELVELESLMGPGVDPHLYKATARDVIAMRRADLIIYSGLHLEGRLAETFEKAAKRGRTIVAAAENIPEEHLITSAAFVGSHDPHVWFDPTLWNYAVDAVVESLVRVDGENEAAYREEGDRYKASVAALVEWTKSRIEQIPEGRRVLVTSHDAYSYLGLAFGIEVVGVQGISTATEAGLADVTKMVDFIKKRGILAIFAESSVSPGTIQRISEASGAVVGGELYSDALGAVGEMHEGADGELYDVGTYIGMFKTNVDTIVSALK